MLSTPYKPRFILVDCNNFFVSCERVFDPRLHKKPVVVMSSNDACVIARSQEAKALNIPMGIPVFQGQALFKKHNVHVLSSNFSLYGDMSSRVMRVLAQFASDIEIYSIDEAFLFVPHTISLDQPEAVHFYYRAQGLFIRDQVKKQTGIPVSLGIGPTKTLAKLANKLAKKNPEHQHVFDLTDHPEIDAILATLDVKEIWGIGRRFARLLKSKNITTARDFKYTDERWVQKNMSVVGLKTLLELRGISCLDVEEMQEDKKSITVSRALGRKVSDIHYLKEAIASHAARAAEKLRAQRSVCNRLTVFISARSYADPDESYYNARDITFAVATDYTPDIIDAAHACLQSIFKQGCMYTRVGVLMHDLIPREQLQLSTYQPSEHLEEKDALMIVMDSINARWGKNKLLFAAQKETGKWSTRREKLSPCYTTSWQEILKIKI